MSSTTHYLRIRVIEGIDLIAADSNGFSDPYTIISLGKLKKKTPVIKKTLNPLWNFSTDFPIELPATIKFKVMDKDIIKSDDFIGEVFFDIEGLTKDKELIKTLKLQKVKNGSLKVGFTALTFGETDSSHSTPGYISGITKHSSSIPTTSPQTPPYSPTRLPSYAQVSPVDLHASDSKLKVSQSAASEGYNIRYDEIEFEKKIGVGAFGEVWKGEWAGTSVAIKKILKLDICEADLAEFSTEILLMSKLRHPNIVQFLGACLEPEFCLIAEYMDRGCLFDVVQKDYLTWQRKTEFCIDIARGMMYLHSRTPPIIHRDIKSLNILVTKDWKCTISDFGLTRIKDKAMLSTRCGSPAWSAPEVLRGEQYDERADVYSYAIVMWEIFAQQPPYQGLNPNQVIGQVAFMSPGMRPPVPECPYPALIAIMKRCWDNDTAVRALFPEILKTLKGILPSIID